MTSQEAAVKAQEQQPEGRLYTSTGAPYKSPAKLEDGLRMRGYNIANYEVVKILDEEGELVGYVADPIAAEEEYWWVKFQAKGHPNDPDRVNLSVEGETLTIQREKEICLPQRFLECADHATYAQYRVAPNKPRKVVANVTLFPYQKLRPGTKEEFETQLRVGTEKTLAHLEKYGWDSDGE